MGSYQEVMYDLSNDVAENLEGPFIVILLTEMCL